MSKSKLELEIEARDERDRNNQAAWAKAEEAKKKKEEIAKVRWFLGEAKRRFAKLAELVDVEITSTPVHSQALSFKYNGVQYTISYDHFHHESQGIDDWSEDYDKWVLHQSKTGRSIWLDDTLADMTESVIEGLRKLQKPEPPRYY